TYAKAHNRVLAGCAVLWRNRVSHEIDRRHFLKSIAAGGTVALTSWTVSEALTTEGALARGCKVFTAPQAALVEAIAEQIVPSDDFPGGKGAGVVFYI